MSDAIDNAEVMLYAVSEAYKESGNCRLEANYAHQQDVDMIPLLVEKGYRPKGWLGLVQENDGVERFQLTSDGSIDTEDEPSRRSLRLGLPTEAKLGFINRGQRLQGSRAVGATIHPGTGELLIPHTQSAPGGDPEENISIADAGGYGGDLSLDNRAFDVPTRPVDTVITVVDGTGDDNIIAGRHAVADPTTGAPMHTLVALPMDIAHHPTHSLALLVGEGTDNVLVVNTLVPDPMAAPIVAREICCLPAPRIDHL